MYNLIHVHGTQLKMERLGGKSGLHRRSWITLMLDFGIRDDKVVMGVSQNLPIKANSAFHFE